MWAWIRRVMLAAVVLCAVSCGGAYADAIAQGDKYAEAGMWDEAAAAYEQASKLDPSDEEAKIKLQQARKHQAADRLARAEALEKRGEIVAALSLAQEAVGFDPTNTQAQRALNRITDAALDRAEDFMKGGHERKAFELTSLVLKGAPHHSRARRLDAKVRNILADKSFKRAKAFLEKDKLGNALVELAACLYYRPDYPDAKLHFGQVKLRLQDDLRYHVVMPPFAGAGNNGQLSRALKPELLSQALDERLLLRVATEPPADGLRGVQIQGAFEGYRYGHQQRKISRSCDYVCGEDSKPNPERPRLEQDVADRERTLSQAESDIASVQKDILRYEQEVTRIDQDVQRRVQDAERARADLDRCRSQADPADTSACGSEQSRLESAQRSLESERRRLESPQSNLTSARNRLGSAQDRKETARAERDRILQQLRNTPELITVPRYCPFNYQVELHDVGAEVTLKLTVRQLAEDRTVVQDQPFRYAAADKDQTFPAHPGRCPEVAQGDPLNLPSEGALRKKLLTEVVKDLRKKVMASYDSYRQEFLTQAQRHEAAGVTEEAIEAYVRYVLTGPHVLKQKKQIAEFFSKAKGLGKLDVLWTQ